MELTHENDSVMAGHGRVGVGGRPSIARRRSNA